MENDELSISGPYLGLARGLSVGCRPSASRRRREAERGLVPRARPRGVRGPFLLGPEGDLGSPSARSPSPAPSLSLVGGGHPAAVPSPSARPADPLPSESQVRAPAGPVPTRAEAWGLRRGPGLCEPQLRRGPDNVPSPSFVAIPGAGAFVGRREAFRKEKKKKKKARRYHVNELSWGAGGAERPPHGLQTARGAPMSDPGCNRAERSRPESTVWGIAKFAQLRRGSRAPRQLLTARSASCCCRLGKNDPKSPQSAAVRVGSLRTTDVITEGYMAKALSRAALFVLCSADGDGVKIAGKANREESPSNKTLKEGATGLFFSVRARLHAVIRR